MLVFFHSKFQIFLMGAFNHCGIYLGRWHKAWSSCRRFRGAVVKRTGPGKTWLISDLLLPKAAQVTTSYLQGPTSLSCLEDKYYL